MKIEAEVDERYEDTLKQQAYLLDRDASLKAFGNMPNARMQWFMNGARIWEIGWILGKEPEETARDLDEMIRWVHRENPSIAEAYFLGERP